MSGSNCCFLSCIQVSQEAGKVVWYPISLRISSVQSLSQVQLFATPWTTIHHCSLSITNFQNLLKLMSFESLMPSSHLILCCPLLLLLSIFPRGQAGKAMAPHSSTLAWKIPWMEEHGRLQFMGSPRVRHDFTFTFTFHFQALEKEMATHSSVLAWRIPRMGEPGGCRLWGHTESDTTEAT